VERDAEYYLDWLAKFVQSVEDAKAARKARVKEFWPAMIEHPQSKWLVKRATWEGVGVLQFKAMNPDWKAQYMEAQARYLYEYVLSESESRSV
jgi:hypothetical protein